MRASLATLKDVAGIMGSFVCTPDGRLVSREISAVFDDGVLAEAGSRLLRMREAFAAGGDELEVGVIRFRDHRIYMKTVGNSMLMILAEGRRQHARAAHGRQPGGPADRGGGRARRGGAAACSRRRRSPRGRRAVSPRRPRECAASAAATWTSCAARARSGVHGGAGTPAAATASNLGRGASWRSEIRG